MQYSFRLAEMLGHIPDPRKRPGTIKAIVEYTGLDRHQVAALLKNEVKYIPIKALSRLCDYLIEHGHAEAASLPGSLFAVEPENFWELLARRQRVEFCLGVRRDVEADNPEVSFVVASDSVLLGELLNGVTTLGGSARHRKSGLSDGSPAAQVPHPDHLKQTLVWSPGQAADKKVLDRAKAAYKTFNESQSDKALIALGSTKSNPVVEIMMAEAFNCDPFVSQDHVASPQDRSVPFFLRYRDKDPHFGSCLAGLELSKGQSSKDAGIWFEDENGKWQLAKGGTNREDCAFLFYLHRESQGRLEMVMGGFSGRATRLLARTLAGQAEEFWPPTVTSQGIQCGGFVIKYGFSAPERGGRVDILDGDLSASTRVVRIGEQAIVRCLERSRPEAPRLAEEEA